MKLNLQQFGGRGARSHSTGGTNYIATGLPNMMPNNNPQMPIQPQIDPNQIQPTTQMAQQMNAATFSDTDNSPFHDLYNGRQYYASQAFDIDAQMAVTSMLDNMPEPNSQYSPSQNLNMAMATGQRLTGQQQFTHDVLMDNMHNLGYNINLQRYDHPDFINGLLKQVGMRNPNYMNMSNAQLQKALVGHTYSEHKFLSTSYNDFRQAADPSTFTSRACVSNTGQRPQRRPLCPVTAPVAAWVKFCWPRIRKCGLPM